MHGQRLRTVLVLAIITATGALGGCFASAPANGPECDPGEGIACPPGKTCIRFACYDLCRTVADCAGHEACLDGACQPYASSCDSTQPCADGWYCENGSCRRDLSLGKPCQTPTECSRGFCVDGVCCDARCDGTCMACSAALTGQPNGACAPIPAGQDPADECPETDCEEPRTCDGAGACVVGAANGTACDGCGECASGFCVDGVCCDAACDGECVSCFSALTGVASGTCAPTQEGLDPDDECATLGGCDGAGACDPGFPLGQVCAVDGHCASGHCADGVCCNAACDGVCEACHSTLTGVTSGECTAIPEHQDPQNECVGTASCSGLRACKVPVDSACAVGADCLSGYCLNQICSIPPGVTVPEPFFPWNGYTTGTLHVARNLLVTFRWRPAVGGVGGLTYELAVDSDCSTAAMQSCTFPSPDVSITTADTAYTTAQALSVSHDRPVGRRYFWRVRACDSIDACSSWSPVRYVDVGREAKDVNGDGYADLVVGAPSHQEAGGPTYGAIFVYPGSPSGLDVAAVKRIDGPEQYGSKFGGSVRMLGDVNADGCADIAVGATAYDGAVENSGRVYVLLGDVTDFTDPPAPIDRPAAVDATGFGMSVLGADVNGDGYADLVTGTKWSTTAYGSDGAAFVFLGGPAGVATTTSQVLLSPAPVQGGSFGEFIGGGADWNGDGYSDVVIMSRESSSMSDGSITGVHLFHGGSAMPLTFVGQVVNPTDVPNFGIVRSRSVDLNRDGYADLVLNGVAKFGVDLGVGAIFVFYGSQAGLSQLNRSWSLLHSDTWQGFGFTASAAADVDGDGLTEIVTAAFSESVNGVSGVGAGYLVEALPSAGLGSPFRLRSAADAGEGFGFAASALGDLNGDGYGDVVFSTQISKLYMYLGSAGGLTHPPSFTLVDPSHAGTGGGWFGVLDESAL